MVGWIGRTLSGLFSSVGVSNATDNETAARLLHREAKPLFDPSHYPTGGGGDYALDLAVWLLEELDLPHSTELLVALAESLDRILLQNAIPAPEIEWEGVDHDGEEGRQLRGYLERHKRFHANQAINERRFREGLLDFYGHLLDDLPDISFSEGSSGFGLELGNLLPRSRFSVDALLRRSFDGDLVDVHLFEELRNQFQRNIFAASGVDPNNPPSNPHRYRMPRDFSWNREELYRTYLAYTPFRKLLETPLPFSIPTEARFEHTHIVGGTGHGKTQLLSHLILQDMGDVISGKRKSIVVIDSQGDLITKLSSLAVFHPTNQVGLGDHLVIIDPRDIEYPTALNMFSVNEDRLAHYGSIEQERVFNGAVELYEHFFTGLLGAELTAKQGVAFTYMARMMLELPNSTIHTLRDVMDNPHAFKDQFDRFSPGTRMFVERELLSKSYNGTRKQISQRLWGMLSIPAFERMFGQSENKVDLFELMNSGKIILINTSKDLLKEEGSAIFGKFFLAAIARAIGERSVLRPEERTDTIIYLDEAHEYADQSLEVLLNQGRKYRAGVVIAHQFLDQLEGRTRQALLANASIKMVGGLSHKDTQTFAPEMNTSKEFLSSLRKHHGRTEFGLWIKHQLPEATKLTVPFGLLDSAKRISPFGEQLLLEQNRERYCVEAQAVPAEEVTDSPTPTPKVAATEPASPIESEGRGGKQHRDIQQMVKGIGHDLGFGVAIEARCQNSEGAIDVLLSGERNTIAIEVSITTSPEHELENLQKCLAEPVTQVLCVSPNDEHRLAIQNLCIERLPQTQLAGVGFLNPSSLAQYLSHYDERESTLIRGYEVVTRTVPSDVRDMEYRRNRIRRVIEGDRISS